MFRPSCLVVGLMMMTLALVPGLSNPARAAEPKAGEETEVLYASPEQGALTMRIRLPKDWTPTDHRPAIIFFFGGGWRSGSIKQFETQAEYFASRGLVAARADYRVNSRHGTSAAESVEDARAALRWLRDHASEYGIDPKKLIASGGSAGGHLAACMGMGFGDQEAKNTDDKSADAPSRPCALVLFNPVLTIDAPQILRMARVSPEIGKTISPTLFVESHTPPALLFYGTDDPLEAQAQPYLDACKKAGVRAELYSAEGVGHGFFNHEPWLTRTMIRADEFLASLGLLEGPPTLKDKPKGE